LSVDKLAKTYGHLWALRDVSLELAAGDLVALLGPNGAGKTTLLKLMCGLTTPSRGSIKLDGESFSGNPPALRTKIGFLAPTDHIYENLTIRENLTFFTSLYNKNSGPSAIDSALAAVNLAHRGDEYIANLSSGMKCRLSIAKWQLLQPELLLLDEPYGVLDGGGVDLLEGFLQSRCALGNVVIMASHHVSRALKLCTRALILHQGRLIFNEIKTRPWPSFDAAFGEFLPREDTCSC
jgi:heme ABC exporter ATP-binding subunit CcmA